MATLNKIINFKLDKETIKQLMKEKVVKLDVKKNESPEIILPESRIKLDIDKKSPTTAIYYNNKSTNLHLLGNTISATANIKKTEKRTKNVTTTKGIESLDIPSPMITHSPVISSASSPPLNKKSTLKKPVKNTSKKLNNNNNNIPRTPQSNNTPRPSTIAPNEKLSDRVLQLLALKPYQISTLAKLLDCTQWDVKKIVDDVGFLLPDPSQKKKYCLKPTHYKKIRIWDWPSYTQEEKLTVLENTKEAYELLQIPLDSTERHNLLQQKELERIIKKSNNKKSVTVEKKSSLDLKGKGKTNTITTTTPSGFSYTSTTTPEPPAPTPSPLHNKVKSSPQKTPQSHLKPSSSNKKVGSKALPQTTTRQHASHHQPVSSKRVKPSDVSHDSVIELSHIGSQPMFDKYCSKFMTSQKEYQHTKSNFKSKFPHYIHILQTTKPPTTGSKRSYFDLKLEYYDLVKENYLKTEDIHSWEEAESQLRDCNEKRRRLNYMWSSIEKNMNEHHYKIKQ